jgi:dTDP-4-dehydrorhamnose reductase
MTNVLITGGSGLLALNWAVEIRQRCAVTIAVHSRSPALAGANALRLALDDPRDLCRQVAAIRPDLVIHAAGLTSVEACEANPAAAQHVNCELAANVARSSAECGARLVHISTDHLFAGQSAMVTEDEPVRPTNAYAASKAAAELAVLRANPAALVVRTNFFGWGPRYRRSFSDGVLDALRQRSHIVLFDDIFYTPIVIRRLVHAVHDLVGMGATGIVHVVGDQRVSKYEFGLELARIFNLDATLIARGSIQDLPHLARRPRDMSLSNQLARRQLGRPLGGVEENVRDLLDQQVAGVAAELTSL